MEGQMRLVKFLLFLCGAGLCILGVELASSMLRTSYQFNSDLGLVGDLVLLALALALFLVLLANTRKPRTSKEWYSINRYLGVLFVVALVVGFILALLPMYFRGEDFMFSLLLFGEQILRGIGYVLFCWAISSLFERSEKVGTAK